MRRLPFRGHNLFAHARDLLGEYDKWPVDVPVLQAAHCILCSEGWSEENGILQSRDPRRLVRSSHCSGCASNGDPTSSSQDSLALLPDAIFNNVRLCHSTPLLSDLIHEGLRPFPVRRPGHAEHLLRVHAQKRVFGATPSQGTARRLEMIEELLVFSHVVRSAGGEAFVQDTDELVRVQWCTAQRGDRQDDSPFIFYELRVGGSWPKKKQATVTSASPTTCQKKGKTKENLGSPSSARSEGWQTLPSCCSRLAFER